MSPLWSAASIDRMRRALDFAVLEHREALSNEPDPYKLENNRDRLRAWISDHRKEIILDRVKGGTRRRILHEGLPPEIEGYDPVTERFGPPQSLAPRPSPERTHAIYIEALRELRRLDAQSLAAAHLRDPGGTPPVSRRFGAEADARWEAFRGELDTRQRLAILFCDAAVEWPSVFGGFANVLLDWTEALRLGRDHPGDLSPRDADDIWHNTKGDPV